MAETIEFSTWSEFKQVCIVQKELGTDHKQKGKLIDIYAQKGSLVWHTVVEEGTADYVDFTTNYMSSSNLRNDVAEKVEQFAGSLNDGEEDTLDFFRVSRSIQIMNKKGKNLLVSFDGGATYIKIENDLSLDVSVKKLMLKPEDGKTKYEVIVVE